jgi:hypothetical protein
VLEAGTEDGSATSVGDQGGVEPQCPRYRAYLEVMERERRMTAERQASFIQGFKWNSRPVMAKSRGRHDPSRFRIYLAKKGG